MAIPSIKQNLFKILFDKDVSIKIKFFNSLTFSLVGFTILGQIRGVSLLIVCTPLPARGGGGWGGVEPPTKFSKGGNLTGPQLL